MTVSTATSPKKVTTPRKRRTRKVAKTTAKVQPKVTTTVTKVQPKVIATPKMDKPSQHLSPDNSMLKMLRIDGTFIYLRHKNSERLCKRL